MDINDWSQTTLTCFVMQKCLIVYASTRLNFQASWAIPCRTHARGVKSKVPSFQKQDTFISFLFQSRSLLKRSSFCFYWESLSNRWVLSNTLMNTICSQYFTNRQQHMVNFIWLRGLVLWTVHRERLEPVRVAWTCPTNWDHFDFVGLVAWSKFGSQLLDFFLKLGISHGGRDPHNWSHGLVSPCADLMKLHPMLTFIVTSPIWELITILLFKGPVRGAFCARSWQGFRGSDWEFCFISRPFIFNASSLTFSVDSTVLSFLFSFHLYSFILSFDLVFPVGFFRIVIGFTRSNYRLSSTCYFFANMCYHAPLCNHLCNVLFSLIL